MSTNYYLVCSECEKRSDYFSRQAWGWGNWNGIAIFKFLAKHLMHDEYACDKHLFVVSEHGEEASWERDDLSGTELEKREYGFSGAFPHSDDWSFMRENSGEGKSTYDVDAAWMREWAK